MSIFLITYFTNKKKFDFHFEIEYYVASNLMRIKICFQYLK